MIRLGDDILTHDEVKELLMTRFDEIVDAIKNDKVVEIKRCTDNSIQLFEVKKKIIKNSNTKHNYIWIKCVDKAWLICYSNFKLRS